MLKFDQLSFWEKSAVLEEIDFLIVGAGLVGFSTAMALRDLYPDAKIVILERGYLSTGASTKNAGFACFGSATELIDDLKIMPEAAVWETVDLRFRGLTKLLERFSVEEIRYINSGSWDLIHEKNLDTRRETSEQLDYLNKKIKEITGSENCFNEDLSVSEKFGFRQIPTSFHNRLEGEIRTDQLLISMNRKLASAGIIVLYGVEVLNIESFQQNTTLTTNFGEISGKKVAITVNGFAQKLLKDKRINPARAQVLVTSPIDNLKLKGTFHYDAGYYYFRNIGNRILLGGGRNLDIQGETTTEFENTSLITDSLTNLLQEVIIPGSSFTVDYQWAGIMGVGNEKKPIIELIHPNAAIGVRMGGMGIAIGSIVGEKLAKLLL
jgi:glycine/D-amino acid oxidase-like deaminating enzyme